MARILPGTRIDHYGNSGGQYKIGWREERAAELAGYIVERRGTHYIYVRRMVRSVWNRRAH